MKEPSREERKEYTENNNEHTTMKRMMKQGRTSLRKKKE